MNQLKKLLQTGFLHIFSSQVLNKIISSCSGIILLNFISKSDYGVYSYALNALSTFLMFSGLGMSTAILQMGSENLDKPYKQNLFTQYGLRVGMVFNLLLCGAILVFCAFFRFPIAGAGEVLALMALTPLFYYAIEVYQCYFRVKLYNKQFSYMSTGIALASSVMLILGALLKSLPLIVILRYVAYIIVLAVIIPRYRLYLFGKVPQTEAGEEEGNQAIRREEKKDVWRVSLISLFNNSVSSLLYIIDGWLIGAMISDASVLADYHTATLIPFALSFIPSAIVTYVYPYVASHQHDGRWLKKQLKLLYLSMAGVTAVISLGLYFAAPLIFRILFPNYTSAIPIFRVLSIGFFFMGTLRILSGNILAMLHQFRWNAVVAVISGVANIVFDVLLIRAYGSIGAAIATTGIYILSGLLSLGYLFYYLKKLD